MFIFISIIIIAGYGVWAGVAKAVKDYEYNYGYREGVEDFIAR
jgi:hypothetical protein